MSVFMAVCVTCDQAGCEAHLDGLPDVETAEENGWWVGPQRSWCADGVSGRVACCPDHYPDTGSTGTG